MKHSTLGCRYSVIKFITIGHQDVHQRLVIAMTSLWKHCWFVNRLEWTIDPVSWGDAFSIQGTECHPHYNVFIDVFCSVVHHTVCFSLSSCAKGFHVGGYVIEHLIMCDKVCQECAHVEKECTISLRNLIEDYIVMGVESHRRINPENSWVFSYLVLKCIYLLLILMHLIANNGDTLHLYAECMTLSIFHWQPIIGSQ